MTQHQLYIEFMIIKRVDNTKSWFIYKVFGSAAAIEHYQSTHESPLYTRVSGIPIFMVSMFVGKSCMLRFDEKNNRYYADNDMFNVYRDTAKQHTGDMFRYYMDLAEQSRSIEIPQSIKDITPVRDAPAVTPQDPGEVKAPDVQDAVDDSKVDLNV